MWSNLAAKYMNSTHGFWPHYSLGELRKQPIFECFLWLGTVLSACKI